MKRDEPTVEERIAMLQARLDVLRLFVFLLATGGVILTMLVFILLVTP